MQKCCFSALNEALRFARLWDSIKSEILSEQSQALCPLFLVQFYSHNFLPPPQIISFPA